MTHSNSFPYLRERLSIFVDGNNMFYAQQKNGWFLHRNRHQKAPVSRLILTPWASFSVLFELVLLVLPLGRPLRK